MDVVVKPGEVEQLAPLTELAATSTVHQVEIRHSLLALQDNLTARMVKKSIDHSTFMHINGLIATAKYNKEFNSAGPSIWDVNPRDGSSYEAILSTLGLEPLPIQYDAKVIPVSSEKEHPSTVTLVVITGSGSGGILPGNSEDSNIPQVAGDMPLETVPERSADSDNHTSENINIDDNVDYTDMPGLTKEQVDKSCTSGILTSTSKAPSTVFSLAKPGSLFSTTKEETHELHLRNIILSGDYYLPLSPSDTVLNHRSQEVKMLYDISLHSPCAASYQSLVDRGKGTNCFDVPDLWPNLQLLWDYDTHVTNSPMLYLNIGMVPMLLQTCRNWNSSWT